jgi:hypothetical protein
MASKNARKIDVSLGSNAVRKCATVQFLLQKAFETIFTRSTDLPRLVNQNASGLCGLRDGRPMPILPNGTAELPMGQPSSDL